MLTQTEWCQSVCLIPLPLSKDKIMGMVVFWSNTKLVGVFFPWNYLQVTFQKFQIDLAPIYISSADDKTPNKRPLGGNIQHGLLLSGAVYRMKIRLLVLKEVTA